MSRERPYTFEEAAAGLKKGDTFSIEGVYMVRNTDRKWWQFWKPRKVIDRSRLQTFIVL